MTHKVLYSMSTNSYMYHNKLSVILIMHKLSTYCGLSTVVIDYQSIQVWSDSKYNIYMVPGSESPWAILNRSRWELLQIVDRRHSK